MTEGARASDQIARELRRMIVGGEMGDTLRPTNELMTRFGVSRPTLREAFRVLESERLIAVKRGSRSGIRILKPSGEGAVRVAGQTLQASGATIEQLYEARLAFEPFAAALLARRSDRRDIAALRAELAKLDAFTEAQRWADLAAGLARFHFVLVELTGNKMLALTAETIVELLERHQRNATRPPETDPARIDADLAFRRLGPKSIAKLVRLIEKGDAPGAETHWRAHLANANDYWLGGQDRHAVIDIVR